MKLTAGRIEGFIKRLDPAQRSVLLYGPDTGLIAERARMLETQIVDDLSDPFRVVDITADKIKETPSLIADEASAISFGGGRRLIRLRDIGASQLLAIQQAIEVPGVKPEDAFILVLAGDLKKNDVLRVYYEQGKEITAVPCYNEDEKQLAPLVAAMLREAGYSFEDDVPRLLAERCQGDRLIIRREAEKLMLYVGEENAYITLQDALACTDVTTESMLDDIVEAAFAGDFQALYRHLHKAYGQGSEPVAILRAAQRYVTRLYQVEGEHRAGKEDPQAMQSLRPPLFFKRLPAFRKALMIWRRKG
ncbi:MAG: DNA polymerase III subunit delta, partial [Rickettsiales bacterium]|nr:DNA polymerase III subunit delta [Rickettsiales bacterium]